MFAILDSELDKILVILVLTLLLLLHTGLFISLVSYLIPLNLVKTSSLNESSRCIHVDLLNKLLYLNAICSINGCISEILLIVC